MAVALNHRLAPTMAPATTPPQVPRSSKILLYALEVATETWQNDLKVLFDQAKFRYADIVWDRTDDNGHHIDEIWGHKAIIDARASLLFQKKYFSSRAMKESSLHPMHHSPHDQDSPQILKLPLASDGTLFRVPEVIDSSLFLYELEYLYTGRGMWNLIQFLSDPSTELGLTQIPEPSLEEKELKRLRQDLLNMWSHQLHSDIRITIKAMGDSSSSGQITFSAHRFILVSRVPYFRSLMSAPLPSPPFTPSSLYLSLGFIYSGTMAFKDCDWDLKTVFDVIRSAKYLGLDTLKNEARAWIIEGMMHGLFRAYLPTDEYEWEVKGKWGTGGCECDECQRRAPRVLEHAMKEDIRDLALERGAQRALVNMYGEGWVTPEFLELPLELKEMLSKTLEQQITTRNIIPLLVATQAGLNKLASNSESPAEEVKQLMHQVRRKIDAVTCNNLDDLLEQPEWISLLESDTAGFPDVEKFDLVLKSIRRGWTAKNVGRVYQTLVSSVLLRPGSTPGTALLSTDSMLRASVELLRKDAIEWIARHRKQMSGCFKGLERWVLKEIGGELEMLAENSALSESPSVSTLQKETQALLITPNSGLDSDAKSTNTHSLRKKLPKLALSSISTVNHKQRSENASSWVIVEEQPHKQAPDDSLPPFDDIARPKNNQKNDFAGSSPTSISAGASTSKSITVGESKEPIPGDVPISKVMSINDVVSHLVAHGCQDMANDVDRATLSKYPISHGGLSDIYRGRLLDNTHVAIKTLRVSVSTLTENPKHLKHAAQELHTWMKCRHPNVLPLMGLLVLSDRIGMVSPWMGRGNLPRYLEQTPDADRYNLRSPQIHGDLKGVNVLVSDDGLPVLIDFGNSLHLSRSLKFTRTTSSSSLTVRWAAAELIIGSITTPNEASDVYALGMPPERPKEIPTGRKDADKLWKTLLRCWSFDPKARPNAGQVAVIMRTITNQSSTSINTQKPNSKWPWHKNA
ncbi:hypothetical protein RHS04_08605 [Rhizoctonia solani]|uniref:Protein kinase domain-containing protein n=1 Tax=Rhizoctonia solani TaxID=456999 RepID=A0A8H7LGA3_9AGAM|nr:hypothetical protein RHS04_08605 [Rhizoctonia solani]